MDSHDLSLAGFYPHLFTRISRSPEGLVHLFLEASREFCMMFKKVNQLELPHGFCWVLWLLLRRCVPSVRLPEAASLCHSFQGSLWGHLCPLCHQCFLWMLFRATVASGFLQTLRHQRYTEFLGEVGGLALAPRRDIFCCMGNLLLSPCIIEILANVAVSNPCSPSLF